MPSIVEASRVRSSLRLVAISALAAAAAGCSTDVARFERGGTFYAAQGNTPPAAVTGSINPRAQAAPSYQSPPPYQAAPTYGSPAPVGRVESQPLPTGQGASALPPPPAQQYAAPPPAQTPRVITASPAPPPAAPAAAPARRSAVHVVERGDTLISISRRYGKSPAEIARANGMKPDTHVRLGQRITVPGVAATATRTAAVAAPVRQPAPAAAQRPAPMPVATAAKPAPARPAPTAKPEERKVVTRGAPPSNLKPPPAQPERVERAAVATPAVDPTANDEAPASSSAGKPAFRWPVRGRVISGFGPKPGGQQNAGINLAVPEGTSVRAAEDGVVAYSGNELKGYGNLVLVRHSNGYVTAYAHANELKVKRGDRVRRGQIIATSGQTGGVASPQLHFEIRRGSTPVDPIQYLASN